MPRITDENIAALCDQRAANMIRDLAREVRDLRDALRVIELSRSTDELGARHIPAFWLRLGPVYADEISEMERAYDAAGIPLRVGANGEH